MAKHEETTRKTKAKKKTAKREQQYVEIGLNIAYCRKKAGLTQLQLAEKADISRTYISNIEAPKTATALSIDVLLDIADALDISAASLLNFDRLYE